MRIIQKIANRFIDRSVIIGIDVSDQCVKACAIEKKPGALALIGCYRVGLRENAIRNGKITDRAHLEVCARIAARNAAGKLADTPRIQYAFIMPEQATFLISGPMIQDGTNGGGIRALPPLSNLVPLEADEQVLQPVSGWEKGSISSVYVSSNEAIGGWRDFAARIGSASFVLLPQSLLLAGSAPQSQSGQMEAAVHIGEIETNLVFYRNGKPEFSYVFCMGGRKLAGIVAESAGIDLNSAHSIILGQWKPPGLDVVQSVKEFAVMLSTGIRESIIYAEKRFGEKLIRINLLGGFNQVKGLANALEQTIGLTTITASFGNAEAIRSDFYLPYQAAHIAASNSSDDCWSWLGHESAERRAGIKPRNKAFLLNHIGHYRIYLYIALLLAVLVVIIVLK